MRAVEPIARVRVLREPAVEDLEEGGAEEGGAGDGEDPGVDDAASYAPADGGKAAGRAYANDGAGNGVSGADGDAENGVGHEREPAGGFRGEATQGAELGDSLAHGFDDSPAPGPRAPSHSES